MTFTFEKATKRQAKARVGISGPAGSGKTYTALLLATNMCERVAVIDTEHGSASKYADEFQFDVLELDDFHPHNYVKAIQAAAQAGYDGLVIDSMSHEWNGKGGCLELVEVAARKSKGGNKWAGWADITPLHNDFIEAIHAAPMHVFATLRSKMDYIQTEDSKGKTKIEKVGMNPITREGAEYELDIVGEMDLQHNMHITKSRCSALADQLIQMPGKELADQIKAWLTDGAPEAAQHGQAGTVQPPANGTQTETPPAVIAAQQTSGEHAGPQEQPNQNGAGDAKTKALRAYHATVGKVLGDEQARKDLLRLGYAKILQGDDQEPVVVDSTKDVPAKQIRNMTERFSQCDEATLHAFLEGWTQEFGVAAGADGGNDDVPF